jgi:phosphoserine phosphatase RsbU/P
MIQEKKEVSVDWQKEFKQTAFKYHSIIIVVAIALNPIWAISDYFVIPNYFVPFLIFRLSSSLLCGITYLVRAKLKDKPEIIAFVPFIAISIQNAYMYSVMSLEQIQTHTFAYIALFIGAGMMVLWDKRYTIIIVILSIIINFIYFSINSTLPLQAILINGALLTGTVALFSIILIQTRTSLTKREIIARLQLAATNKIIEDQNRDITDSINYAKRIQYSVVPSEESLLEHLPDSFIMYQPKDIVSGDFPFTFHKGDDFYIAAADCTGHGVPGAFMSLVGHFSLSQILNNHSISEPSLILEKLNDLVVKSLGQNKPGSKSMDGMDIALCKYNLKTQILEFSGAYRPLYLMRNGILVDIKSDKFPIGGSQLINRGEYSNAHFQLQKGDAFFMFSDGLQDQFGGPEGRKKFMSKNIKQLIIDNAELPMNKFKDKMLKQFNDWKGTQNQTDDVLMIGVRV